MPQSLSKINVHVVFSTKYRIPLISDIIRKDLHAYMGSILISKGCYPVEINSEPDHVHILFVASRTHTISQVVGYLKTSTTHWIRRIDTTKPHSFWQRGYGAFSVSITDVEKTRRYIRGQQEHHKDTEYMDEFRYLLNHNDLEFDERYVWD